ncbi:MAG TPA: DUF5063 domain-containing protein [Candidatus Dormibacteraeota bacterium]
MNGATVKEAVNRFGEEATEFMGLLDSAIHGDALLTELQSRLPRLFAMAAALPEVSPSNEPETESMSRDQQAAVHRAIDGKLPFKSYWEVCEVARPTSPQPVPGLTLLSDDLADIYIDLHRGFAQSSDVDRVWSWRFSWYTHWGRHAANALRAIHDAVT